MRTIKFRGKTEKGEWVYSNSIDFKGSSELQPYLRDKETYIKINPETVSQYTGLTDKEGTEIYEGDILMWEDEFKINTRTVRVKYYEDSASFKLFGKNDVKSKTPMVKLVCNEYYKVIGNIFDNPEL